MQCVPRKLSACLAAAALSALPGCRRDEITHVKVPKAASSPALARSAAMPPGAGADGEVPPPPAPTGASALKWTLPRGWTETMAGGMRYATLKPPVTGRIEASVVVLPGPAGGELANVNRWRGQIGLSPIDEAALASARKIVKSRAGAVSIYDFSSEGQEKSRVIAGLVVANGNSWFVKMTGDADPVAAARADFTHLLESLRFEDAN
jgi:hypothetical protein